MKQLIKSLRFLIQVQILLPPKIVKRKDKIIVKYFLSLTVDCNDFIKNCKFRLQIFFNM